MLNYLTTPVGKQYADFKGTATRKQYWMFILLVVIAGALIGVIDLLFMGTGFINAIFSIILFVPSLAICARRLHDAGFSGWWQLIGLIPVVGFIALLIMLCLATKPESKYQTTTPEAATA